MLSWFALRSQFGNTKGGGRPQNWEGLAERYWKMEHFAQYKKILTVHVFKLGFAWKTELSVMYGLPGGIQEQPLTSPGTQSHHPYRIPPQNTRGSVNGGRDSSQVSSRHMRHKKSRLSKLQVNLMVTDNSIRVYLPLTINPKPNHLERVNVSGSSIPSIAASGNSPSGKYLSSSKIEGHFYR